MKYKFIYDKDFLENRYCELSFEEADVIRTIVCGGHHALIFGYKPERLLNAIMMLTKESMPQQKPEPTVTIEQFCGGGESLAKGCVSLADGGILFMENLHEFRYSVISMATAPMDNGSIRLSRAGEFVDYPAHFQLIATTKACECGNYNSTQHACLCSLESVTRWWNRIGNIAKRCDIVYACSDSADVQRTLVPIKSLKEWVKRDWDSHIYETGVNTKNCEISNFTDLSFTEEADSIFHSRVVNNPVYNPVRIARVARTIADIHEHNMIRIADVTAAMNWCHIIQ